MEMSRKELAQALGLPWALGYQTLYKFKCFEGEQRDHVIDVVENSRVFFAESDQFNDPYDIAPIIRLGGDADDPEFVKELEAVELGILQTRGLTEEQIAEMRETRGEDIASLAQGTTDMIREELRASSRFFCLTAERCHPLQWSHYADHHRGLCLHFDCSVDTVFGLAREVAYRTTRDPILLPLSRQDGDVIVERMALLKADFWSYEKEFRIVAVDGVDWGSKLDGTFLNFEANLLSGITIGMRMPDDQQSRLIKIVNTLRPGLPVWRAIEDEDNFWMQLEQLQ